MKKTFNILLIAILISFAGCSSDDKGDPNKEIHDRIEKYRGWIAKTELDIIDKTKFCQDNEASEGGYDKCYEGWIAPLERKIKLYNEKIAELEKKLETR